MLLSCSISGAAAAAARRGAKSRACVSIDWWTRGNTTTSTRTYHSSPTLCFAKKKHKSEGNPVNEAGYGELGNVVVSTDELGRSLPGGRDLYRGVSVSILHGAKIGERLGRVLVWFPCSRCR